MRSHDYVVVSPPLVGGSDDGPLLVRTETLDPRASRGDAKRMFDIGLHHFGFWVDDLDAVVSARAPPVFFSDRNCSSSPSTMANLPAG